MTSQKDQEIAKAKYALDHELRMGKRFPDYGYDAAQAAFGVYLELLKGKKR